MPRANNNKSKTQVQKAPENTQIVVQEIRQVSVDRTPKDVGNLMDSLRSAESVFYPNRSRLLDLYETVWLDGHLTGIWNKRSDDATNRDIVFVDASGKKIDALDDLMDKSEKWDELLDYIMASKLWGLSGIQFLPGQTFDWCEIPRKHIGIEKGVIKINQTDQEGIPYADNPLVWVIGKKKDLGLMLKCSFYALIKKGNFADWAQYSEIFGQPIRVIKYDAFDDKTRIQLKQVLDESGSSLALMIPKQAEFDIMDGKTSNGNGDLQNKLKDACNNEMSVVILGNTETTTSDNGGSNAKAQEQGNQQDKLNKKDIKFLLSQLNSAHFINILKLYGYPVEGGKFTIAQETDTYKIQALATSVQTLRQAGTPVGDDWVYEQTGIPKPDDYDQIKADEAAQKTATQEQIKQGLNPNETEIKDKGKDKEKPDPEDLTDSLFNKIRLRFANFFDPAPTK